MTQNAVGQSPMRTRVSFYVGATRIGRFEINDMAVSEVITYRTKHHGYGTITVTEHGLRRLQAMLEWYLRSVYLQKVVRETSDMERKETLKGR